MKQIFHAGFIGIFFLLASTTHTIAQQNDNMAMVQTSKSPMSLKDRSLMDNTKTNNAVFVSARAIKNLNKDYHPVNNKWLQTSSGPYASFLSEDVHYRVYYDKKGRWVASIKSYDEWHMPKDLRKLVRQAYYDHKIVNCAELEVVASKGEPTYIVTVQDETGFKKLRIYGYNIEVLKDLKFPK